MRVRVDHSSLFFEGENVMKILAIGNSFSTDATALIEPIAAAEKWDIFVRNLFIGGCSLETHWQNFQTYDPVYEYQKDGEVLQMISLREALSQEDWDVITLQQVSHLSGKRSSYEPFLGNMIAAIQNLVPDGWIVFHRTWSYEINADHPGFKHYGSSQARMDRQIRSTTAHYSQKYALPVIPSGEIIRQYRQKAPFDYRKGGISLNRDGFHLSLDYGRYIVALTWLWFFLGKLPSGHFYIPPSAEPDIIIDIVHHFPRF
jgi:hypothetical protein